MNCLPNNSLSRKSMINTSLRTLKTTLVIILLMVNLADSITIHGIFQNKSLEENVQTTLKNSSFTGKFMRVTNNSSLSQVISSIENLQEDFSQHKQNNNHVFTDLDLLHASVIKEVIRDYDLLYSTNNNTRKQSSFIALTKRVNKLSKHQYLIDETLSFIEANFAVERSLTVITDKSDFSRVSLTRIVQKCSETKRKISAFQMISEKSSKEEIENLLQGDLFVVDCDGKIATRMLQIARDVGYTGYTDGVSWVFSQRTTETLKLSCSLPEGRYFKVQAGFEKVDATAVLKIAEKCQNIADNQQNLQCERAKQRVKKITSMQLWTTKGKTSDREWVAINKNVNGHNHALQERRNPFWPRLRVAVANTFHPWITIVDFDKTDGREPYCGLYGKYGYRFVNSTTNVTVPICAYGIAIDIVRYLEDKHEIVGDIHVSRDGLYGGYNESSGKATGLVAEILNGDADIAVDMMEEASRRKAVEFTKPYAVTQHGIAYVKNIKTTEAGVFGPFSGLVWAVIMSVIAGLVFLIWALERFSPFGQLQKNKRSSNVNDHIFGIPESMEFIWGTFCCGEIIQQKPVATGSRVTSIFISYVFIMIVAVYSANLITSFVVVDETPLITGLSDPKLLDEKKSSRIGTQLATATSNYVQNHPDVRIRKLSERIRYFPSYKESINALENGEIDFFLSDYLTLKLTATNAQDCTTMEVVQADSNFAPLGLSFKRNSPLKRKLEIIAQNLINSGEKDRLLKFWFGSGSCQMSNKFYELGITHVENLFIWASYGACGCLIIMILMLIWRGGQTLKIKLKERITADSPVSVINYTSKTT